MKRTFDEPATNSGARGAASNPQVALKVIPTKHGLRFSQHGVVVSELRTTAGPTHSVFDVLAALIVLLRPGGRVGMLGFAGGGVLAPLHALGQAFDLAAVDLDRSSYELFQQHCPQWAAGMRWECSDAADWLRRQSGKFDLLLDDLSVPLNGDVAKPDLCWRELPGLMRRRLAWHGVAVFNLLPPAPGGWNRGVDAIAESFPDARLVLLEEFENRILIAGGNLPSTREFGRALRRALRQLESRQAERIRVLTHMRRATSRG